VIGDIAAHRANNAKIIHLLPDVRENLADLDTALAELLKLEGGGKRRASAPLCLQRNRNGFTAVAGERRLRIKRQRAKDRRS